MDVDGFWAIVEAARAEADEDWYEVPEIVTDALSRLPLADIADFAQIQDELEWAAYREDLWTASWLINAGFSSDDGFLYFRDWMLVQGRAAFEAALADPDSLADVPGVLEMDPFETDEFADCEQFLYVANEAWRRATGSEPADATVDGLVHFDEDQADGLEEELERRGFEPHRDDPVPLHGEPVDIDNRDAVVSVLPRLGSRFHSRAVKQRASLPPNLPRS